MPAGKTQRLTSWEGLDFDQAVATANPVIGYWDARVHPYFTLLMTTVDADEDVAVELAASDDWHEDDISAMTYTDVTTDIYGGPIILTSLAPIIVICDTPIVFVAYRITFTPTGSTAWTCKGRKSA